MTNSKLYYLWLSLPDKIKLPPYSRTKSRREEICSMILKSLESGEAKFIKAGENRPNETMQKVKEKTNLFTNVILKYHTSDKIDFSISNEALIHFFLKLFKGSEELIIIGDNTRLQIDTDKYRQVTIEGRKKWFLPTH